MAVVACIFPSDNSEKCRFLTREEKDFTRPRAIRQVGQETEGRLGMVKMKDVLAALIDPQIYLTALIYFSCNVSFSSVPVFLPTTIKGMGYSSTNTQALTARPYFLAGVVSILSTYLADCYQQRGIVIIVSSLVGGTGLHSDRMRENRRRPLSRRLPCCHGNLPRYLQYRALSPQ
jgi:hypothetical protein